MNLFKNKRTKNPIVNQRMQREEFRKTAKKGQLCAILTNSLGRFLFRSNILYANIQNYDNNRESSLQAKYSPIVIPTSILEYNTRGDTVTRKITHLFYDADYYPWCATSLQHLPSGIISNG